jgi:hypothetical protein
VDIGTTECEQKEYERRFVQRRTRTLTGCRRRMVIVVTAGRFVAMNSDPGS